MFDRIDPFARGAHRHHLAWQKKISVSLVLGPADAAAELVKIGQTKTISSVHDDGVRVRNIKATFDNCGAHQNVDFSGDETRHDFLELLRIHLPMANVHARVGTEIDNALADALD